MNSRNLFLLAGAAILILVAAAVLLLAGGDGDEEGGGGDTPPGFTSVDARTAVEALYNGDAGPMKTLACDDAQARLDEIAAELAAMERIEGAEVTFACDVGREAGDCLIDSTAGDQFSRTVIEFAGVDGTICLPIEVTQQ